MQFMKNIKEKNKEEIFKKSIYEFSFDGIKMACTDFKIENDLMFVESKLYTIDDDVDGRPYHIPGIDTPTSISCSIPEKLHTTSRVSASFSVFRI